MNYEKYYEPLVAVNSSDFNRCFYCGCEANHTDYIPPISFIHHWRDANSEAEFIAVLSCNECFDILKKKNNGTLQTRFDVLKALLAEKYKKAITVYNMWSPEELEEMDKAFQISLSAGINLGKETVSRLKFNGFDHEIGGSITRVGKALDKSYQVFDQTFENFKLALEYASSTYQIKKGRLSELYFENGESFDKAIEAFHRSVEARRLLDAIEKPCEAFAKQYNQNRNLVIREVKKYLLADENLTVQEALDKFYVLRVKE
ncbi:MULTISPECIES: hypothetical protein [unclassified Alteromonas]|uniref:hypothetical protein n=1 Tax=unclassified Alteromonas TaxID=2614992 RepID=UPI0009041C6A|nr:hypothetical protein BM528_00490 [Alteromonas sp. RW2A1]